MGRTMEVREFWKRSAELFRQRLDSAPEDADQARFLAVSLKRLGDLAQSAGDPVGARRYYEDGLMIGQRLADSAPTISNTHASSS